MTDKVPMRSEMKQMHDGVLLHRGDSFWASKEEAADMVALKIASIRKVEEPKEEKVVPMKRRGRPRTSDRYQRRDLRAED